MNILAYPELLTQSLAKHLNTQDSNARLIVSLGFGYPIALIYSVLIYRLSERFRHLYLLLTGLALCFWNFSFQIFHMILAVGLTFGILNKYPATGFSVIAVSAINLVYLFIGYGIHMDQSGVISWTTPFCILVLRLIGLAWDLYDGKKSIEQRSDYQKRACLLTMPGLLETYSFCFVPTAFMTGPQFPMRHYQQFINHSLRPAMLYDHFVETGSFLGNKKLRRIASRLLCAVLYLAVYMYLSPMFNENYLTSSEFLYKRSLMYKLTYMGAYAKVCIARYFIIWLIGEGACVLLGLGCTGRVIVTSALKDSDKAGKERGEKRENAVLSESSGGVFPSEYDVRKLLVDLKEGKVRVSESEHTACANVSVVRFEMATNTDGFVSGHNINTNKWMLEYVYKRFRFLGNKYLSQLFTLTFLAVWHGFHSGYFINFFLEFITVIVEKDIISIVKLSKHKNFFYGTLVGTVLTSVAGKIHLFYVLGTPLCCFTLLKSAHYVDLIKATYGIAFIYLLWPLGRPLFRLAFPRKRVQMQSQDDKKKTGDLKSLDEPAPANPVRKVVTSETDNTAQDKPVVANNGSMSPPDEDPLDTATMLRRRSTAAVDEGALDEEEEEISYYDDNAKFVDITTSSHHQNKQE